MADIVLSVASKVAGYLVAPVGRQCGYVIFASSYVDQLEEELDKLKDASQRVQDEVDVFENNMKPIQSDVKKWVEKAKIVINKATVLKNDGRAEKTCFCGRLPNLKARYCLSKEARRTAKEIQALILQCHFAKVAYENPPPGLVGGAHEVNSSAGHGSDTVSDSRTSIFQGIMKALDDEKHKVIGVYGPGGVGKTTLLEEIEKKLKKEGRPFQMIVKATVSRTPDLTKITYDIAYGLSLNLKDLPSEDGRKDLLSKRLKDLNEKVLIILDDLWGALDLKAVGIPSGDESVKCKLLLTSRDKSVLEQRMRADRTFHLKGLSDEEAFSLFERMVGDKLKDDEELKAKAAQVVRKLAGLPLLITSVASTLKCSNVSTWESMLIKMEDPNNERIVKWSYDHLQYEDAKCLFLLSGLIGGTIEVKLLLGLGMGLGLFEGYNERVQYSRNRLNEMLDSLHSFCLLQDGGDGKKNVTIHDLYSEVVVSRAFGGQNSLMMNSNYGPWSKEKLEKCWAIRLACVDKDRLDKLMTCRFPDLKILMLSQPKGWSWMQEHEHEVGDCFGLPNFTYMKELRVLYFRSMFIASLPPSIGILENLHSLYLQHCNVEDVAIFGKLKALQILSFMWSTISRLPKEMKELTNLRSLNLSNCKKFQRIELVVLERLIKLEELHIKGSFNQWMGKNEKPSESCNAGLAELGSMTKLNSLEISIRDPIILLEVDDLPFENLTRFWINIGNADGREFKGLRTMKIKLEGHDGILSKKMGPENSLEDSILAFGWIGRVRECSQVVHSRISTTEASRHSG